MNRLLATTAVVLVFALPVSAQTPDPAPAPEASANFETDMNTGYYQAMQPGDLRASDLIGAEIFTHRHDQDAVVGDVGQAPEGVPADGQQLDTPPPVAADGEPVDGAVVADDPMTAQTTPDDQMRMAAGELGNMDSIGEINELIIDQDGTIRAVVVDVGGFLGMGARQVALDMSQLEFRTDMQDDSQVYVITQVAAQTLETAPEFTAEPMQQTDQVDPMTEPQADGALPADRGPLPDQSDQVVTDEAAPMPADAVEPWRADRERLNRPMLEREGYMVAEAGSVSVDNLIGANVYAVDENNIGSVNDVVVGEQGEVEYVVIDVGGFLGIGSRSVALGFDEITVMHEGDWEDLRVYVDVTRDTLDTIPEYTRD